MRNYLICAAAASLPPNYTRFFDDVLDVSLCFDWFVGDEIIQTKNVQTRFFNPKNSLFAGLPVS